MKSILSITCLLLIACALAEARPKRSIILSSPALASTSVVSVPVVHSAAVVSHNPTTVVKTEQVHSGDHSSYSYSTQVQSNPVVHAQAVAAAPVVATSPVHTTVHTVPTYHYGSYYPAIYGSYPAYHYSPYQYVLGK